MLDAILTPSPAQPAIRRRTRRDPRPHFKPERSRQLDVIAGCPEAHVEEHHLARSVWKIVAQLDLRAVESSYSSLGRHGNHPRRMLAVWVYASLAGLHHGTKLARALKTDLALRLLSGGHAISRSRLNDFRQKHGDLFQGAIEQTVGLAREQGLLPLDELAVDSMRLRAHASTRVRPSTDLLVECIDDDGTSGKYFGRERFTIHLGQPLLPVLLAVHGLAGHSDTA